MKLVLIRFLCAAAIITVIAVTYVILQNLGEKGVKIFRYNAFFTWRRVAIRIVEL